MGKETQAFHDEQKAIKEMKKLEMKREVEEMKRIERQHEMIELQKAMENQVEMSVMKSMAALKIGSGKGHGAMSKRGKKWANEPWSRNEVIFNVAMIPIAMIGHVGPNDGINGGSIATHEH